MGRILPLTGVHLSAVGTRSRDTAASASASETQAGYDHVPSYAARSPMARLQPIGVTALRWTPRFLYRGCVLFMSS
jgi:hypothetical protein